MKEMKKLSLSTNSEFRTRANNYHSKWKGISWFVLSFLVIQPLFITAIEAQIPIKVVGNEVNLRSGPGTGYNIIGKVVRYHKFVAVEKRNDATYGAWYKIAIPSKAGAAYGWIAQKTANGTQLTQEDSSLYGYIVTIINDGGVGWRLRYLPADYDNYLKDKQRNPLKVWNNQKFIYKSFANGSDGCKWWEIYVPYLKDSADWGNEDYLALFVRDDAIRLTGKITGRVLNRANSGIAGASVKPFLKNGHNDDYWNATTSSTGAYTCSGLPESTYTLEVTASGFTKVTVTVSVTSGGTTTQDIVLDETTPPTISNVRIDPSSLPSSGGTVTVRADVTDNVKVQNVWLWIKEPNGTEKYFTMSLESGNTYKGSYTAPANTSSSAVTYKVAVTAKDASNNEASTGWAYSFTVAGQSTGQPPSKPSNPYPPDGATNQPTSLTLSWSSSGATKYDLYFGTSSNPPLYKPDLTSNQYSVPNLSPGTTYYWKVVAKNDYGQTAGDVWRFTTATSVTGRFKIGDRVCVTKAAGWLTVRDSPAGNPVKYMQSGQIGKIIGGPESKEGLTWWKIDWGDVQGWSHESGSKGVYLEALPGVGRISDVTHGNLSWQVEVYSDADPPKLAVRSQPASTELDPPRKPKGARGWTLDEAPVIANGKVWWLIRWDDGLVGWSADSDVGYGVYLVRKATAPFSGKMGLSRDPNQPIDFGAVSVNDSKDLAIRIYNPNDGTSNRVLRGQVRVSGNGFRLLASDTFSLWPGDGRIVTVRFQPTTAGNYSGTLTIEHNASNYPNPLNITLKGNTGNVPVIRLSYSPSSLDFGQVEINTTRELSLTIKNESTSTDTLTVSNIQVVGNGFSLADGQPTAFSLSPGGQPASVQVRFKPTAKADYSGTLRITHNATNIGSPLEIPLTGKGAEVVYRVSINVNPAPSGTVRVNGQQVNLPFEKTYAKGTNLTLEAIANANYSFKSWSGSLSSTNSTLNLTLNSDISLIANFASASTGKHVLNVSVDNSALGEVRIVGVTDWGSSFSREFDSNATVTLEARVKPGISGVVFNGWSGAPSGSSGSSINVKMDRSYSIVALFTDTQKPVVENVALSRTNLNLNDEVTITATATDNIGVKEVIIRVRKPDGIEETLSRVTYEGNNTYSAVYRVSTVGEHTVVVQAKDAQGNLSEEKKAQFNVGGTTIDNKPPAPICIVKPIFKEQETIKFTVTWTSKVIAELARFAGKKLWLMIQLLKPNISFAPIIECDSVLIDIPANLDAKNLPKKEISPTQDSQPIKLVPGDYEVRVKVKTEQGQESEFSSSKFTVVQDIQSQNTVLVSLPNGLTWSDVYVHQIYSTKVGKAQNYDGRNGCGPSTAVMALAILGKLPPKPVSGKVSKFGWYVANAYCYRNQDETKWIEFTQKAPDESGKYWPGAHGSVVGNDGFGHVGKLQTFLSRHNVMTKYSGEIWSSFKNYVADIKNCIDTGNPVIGTVVLQFKTGGKVGHFMLIVGYEVNENGKITRLIALDPYLKNYYINDSGYISPIIQGPPDNYKTNPLLYLPLETITKRLIYLQSDGKLGEVKEYNNNKSIRQYDNNYDEFEPNDVLLFANTIGNFIRGIINSVGDTDYFKFEAQKGEVISIWVESHYRFDPIMTLYDDRGALLALSDDDEARVTLDPAIYHFALPHSGTFYIKIESHDGNGSEDYLYTLYLRREMANDDFGDDFDTATPIERGQRIEGIVGHRGDVDVFRFTAQQGEFLTVDIRARRDGSPLDAIVTLYWETTDENGEVVRKVIGTWDDVNGYDPTVRRLKLPATGTYYLEIRDFNGEGGVDYRYTLNFQIEPPPMVTIDTTPVTADVQMGEQRAQERKVGNIGGGSVGFASVAQQSGKSRRDLPNPFNGRRQVIFLSPKQASVELEKESPPTRLRSPAALSQLLVGESKTLSTPEQKSTNLIGQTVILPLPLGTRMVTRSATSRQASQPPDANAWQWTIVDPTVTTVENACNIHKVWMQRKADTLYFKVETSGRTFDPNTVLLRFNLDTDMSAETGVSLLTNMGVDYLVSVGEGTDGVWKWDSTTEGFAFVSDLSWVKIEGNFVELGLPLSAINDAEEFSLLVEMNDDDMIEQDSAPDEGFALITRLPSWLKVEPLAGTADSGQEVPVTLTLNAEAFDQTGEISGTVQVLSSDPYKERQEIPIEVTVTPPQLPFESTAGLFMVSLPITVDKQWHEILNIPEDQMKLAIYLPREGKYLLYNELALEQRKPRPGVGVWIKLEKLVQTTLTGVPPKASEPFTINLHPGWQIIGVPWQVNWASLKVRKDNEELSIAQAAGRGWVYEILWTWDDQLKDYQMVWAKVAGIGFEEMLRPLKGYWILAMEECQLVIPPKSEATRGVTVNRKQLAENGFVFGLMADDGRAKRRVWLGFCNEVIGSRRGRQGVQAQMPPETPEPVGIQIFALGERRQPLAADIRVGTPNKVEWEIVVRWGQEWNGRSLWSKGLDEKNKEIRLTWDGLGYLPEGMSAFLVDMTTGVRRYLRTYPTYQFRPQPTETERRFKVILEQGGTGLLKIANLKVTSTRGKEVLIQFSLTKPATTQVEVLTLTGRRIAIVESGQSRSAGQQSLFWRGIGFDGSRLPAGTYLIRVTALDEEGRQVQATTLSKLR